MNVKVKSGLIFLVISWGIQVVYSYQSEPESSCTVERTRVGGVCKAIGECPSVLNDIKNRKTFTRCQSIDQTQIVCCPLDRPTTTSTIRPSLRSDARISEEKCDEYKSAVFEYIYSLSLAVGSEPTKIPVDKCGHKTIPLVVGGEDAKPREFPHMALIGFEVENLPSWACGGALISDEYILTAGHCLYSKLYGEPKYIRLGELSVATETDDAKPEDYMISEIIPHPEYDRNKKYNDIALLRLDRKVQLDPYKRPACLPTEFEGPENSVIATGWGHTMYRGNTSDHLQKVILEKFTQDECNSSYAYEINRKLRFGIVPQTQMCAGSRTEAKDTCQGDSGGPLQVFHPNLHCMYTVIGVTSFGITCGNVGVPGIYTRVFPYLDWIESVVWGRPS